MNILVTGGSGFLGSRLTARLVEAGHRVTVVVRSSSPLRRIAHLGERITTHTLGACSFQQTLQSGAIETIIHCATNYGRGNPDRRELLEANLVMPLQLLQAGCDAGVRCFINTDTLLGREVSDYALSKAQFREWLGRYAGRMVCINVALEHFYGAHDDTGKFVSSIVRRLLDGVDSIDLTLGEQKRDFIHVDDVVAAFLRIMDSGAALQSGLVNYQVGTGATTTIRAFVELARLIAGNRHTRLNFGAIPYREHEAMEITVDTTALRALGWRPAIPLVEGLTQMIAQERETQTT